MTPKVTPRLTDEEVALVRERFESARVSLAIEGNPLTEEETAFFTRMLAERIPPDEQLERVRERAAKIVREAKQREKAGGPAAIVAKE